MIITKKRPKWDKIGIGIRIGFRWINAGNDGEYGLYRQMIDMMKQQRYKDGMRIFEGYKDKTGEMTWGMYIKLCGLSGEYSRAKDFLKKFEFNGGYSVKFKTSCISFYGKCGDILMCEKIFKSIEKNNMDNMVVTVMMNCYIWNFRYFDAVQLYGKYGVYNDDALNTIYIKACANINGEKYGNILIHKLNLNDVNGYSIKLMTSLMDYFIRKNDIEKAYQIYDQLKAKDCLSLVVIMNGYIKNNQNMEAMKIYNDFKGQYDDVCKLLYLKALNNINDYENGKKFIDSLNIDENNYNRYSTEFLTTLMDFYGKSGDITICLNIFNSVKPTPALLSVIMNAFIGKNDDKNAMVYFEKYPHLHDIITNMLYLKCCINMHDFNKGKQLINQLKIMDYNELSYEFNTILLDFYCKSGSINKAITIFNQMRKYYSNYIAVLMNALINLDKNITVINIFEYIKRNDNEVIRIMYVKALTNIGDYSKGCKWIHDHKIVDNINKYSVQFITTIIDFYSKNNDIEMAQSVLEKVNKKTAAMISPIMNYYINNNENSTAMKVYNDYNGIHNDITNTLYIKSCINSNDYDKGHHFVNKLNIQNYNNHSLELVTMLMDFYCKFNHFANAMKVYNQLNPNDIKPAIIGVLMNYYISNNNNDKAIYLYETYQHKHNSVTDTLYIKGCVNVGEYNKCFSIIKKLDLDNINNFDIELITLIIDFYGRIGNIDMSLKMYHKLVIKQNKIEAVGAMMNAYKLNKKYQKALDIYFELHPKLKPNGYIYSIALHCCGEVASLPNANRIINSIQDSSLFNDLHIQGSIISMYFKCGFFEESVTLFNKLKRGVFNKDQSSILALYSSIMDCYCKLGNFEKVFEYYNELKANNIALDDFIYSIVINSCTHSGNINDAISIYEELKMKNRTFHPNILVTLTDCISRKNELDLAIHIYETNSKNIHLKYKVTILCSILSSCIKHNNITKSEYIFNIISDLYSQHKKDHFVQESYQTCKVLMSNIYAKNKEYTKSINIRGNNQEKLKEKWQK